MNSATEEQYLKLFICYSHLDEKHINDFRKHTTPLKDNKLIKEWYDRKIIPGKNWRKEIDNNLEDADIICLVISKNFLDSENCKEEKKDAFNLKRKKGIEVVPIILSSCLWKDYDDLVTVLALPKDGAPITSFKTTDDGWYDVCNGLKKTVNSVSKIKQLKIKDDFLAFLDSMELLTKASSTKESIFLEDIFIYPELTQFDDLLDYEKILNSEELIESFQKCSRILIAGEDQSGKTTLAKKLFKDLRTNNFIPIYIQNKPNPLEGKIENKINQKLNEQYENLNIDEIDEQKLIPIIDDFHLVKNKDKYIDALLKKYDHLIVIVDDVYNLNIKNESLRRTFKHYKINEFKPTLRNELITKWTNLTDLKDLTPTNENEVYHAIELRAEFVDTTLGKIIGGGIMPSYPFFILSMMSNYETFQRPLNNEITSQGYCYEALIYLYLFKEDVKSDEIDTYINFLTEFAFYLFKEKKTDLTKEAFDLFMNSYTKKYNFPIDQKKLLRKLNNARIIYVDGFNHILFRYTYIYYFFVAKYLSEHQEENKKKLINIVKNLHKNDNAYIAIFMIHHLKNSIILEKIISESIKLFGTYKPSTLSKKELNFFNKQLDLLVNAVLPHSSPEKGREEKLKAQDMIESEIKKSEGNQGENEGNEFLEFRRSIRTVEVMGQIIKNRHSSLEKDNLKEIFKEAMGVHLRILNAFFNYIQDESEQQELVDYISDKLKQHIFEKGKQPKEEELRKISERIFWNLNMFFIYGLIYKTVHSLGSDKLIHEIIEPICDETNTPASFLIKHGILMAYANTLDIDDISKEFDDKNFSEIAQRIMKFQIVNHCATRKISFAERQKIESKLDIPHYSLLPHKDKNKT